MRGTKPEVVLAFMRSLPLRPYDEEESDPCVEQVPISIPDLTDFPWVKHNGMAVFVKNAVPGDVVDIQITKKKKNPYAEGKAVHFHTYSPDRVTPECRHFGLCGGCTRQDLDYAKQLCLQTKGGGRLFPPHRPSYVSGTDAHFGFGKRVPLPQQNGFRVYGRALGNGGRNGLGQRSGGTRRLGIPCTGHVRQNF